MPRLRGGAPQIGDAQDLEEQLVEERPRGWMEKEMWAKTEKHNESWHTEKIVGGSFQMIKIGDLGNIEEKVVKIKKKQTKHIFGLS